MIIHVMKMIMMIMIMILMIIMIMMIMILMIIMIIIIIIIIIKSLYNEGYQIINIYITNELHTTYLPYGFQIEITIV